MALSCLLERLQPGERRGWRAAQLSDWRLRLGEKEYTVHTYVLGEGPNRSEVLGAQFARWAQGERCTDLTGLLHRELCFPVFEDALDFVYDGELELKADTAVPLFKIAHVLQMPTLAARCVEFLESELNTDSARVFCAHALQLQPGLDVLIEKAQDAMASRFSSYGPDIFDHFPVPAVIDFLSSREEEMSVSKDDAVFDAIAHFVAACPSHLSAVELEALWSHCRFAALSPEKIEAAFELSDIPPRWLKLGVTAQLYAKESREAFEAFVAKTAATDPTAARRLRPRPMNFHFQSPFDGNGILHNIGTQFGSRPYENPHTSGEVLVTWSGGGQGDVATCVSHTQGEVHCFMFRAQGSWVCIDFKTLRVAPSHYCLRSDKFVVNNHKLRNWDLQGSHDGQGWITLRRHVDDTSLTGSMGCAAWSVDPPAEGGSFFRLVRIKQTGPNSSGHWCLACAGFELYGQVAKGG